MQQTITVFRTKTAALAQVGSLSDTRKMPGKSWGISPSLCQTGARLAAVPGTICSDCYACKGAYRQYAAAIGRAHATRLAAWASDRATWRAAMIKLTAGEEYFRWFDAGDVQSAEMLEDIAAVADATPATRHWVATREGRFVAQFLARRSRPANLVIRMSAAMPDVAITPKLTGCVALVHKSAAPAAGAHVCPASKQGGACGSCRACWDSTIAAVSYPAH